MPRSATFHSHSSPYAANLDALSRLQDEVPREGVDDLTTTVDLALELPFADMLLLGAVSVLQGDVLSMGIRLGDGHVALGRALVGMAAGSLATKDASGL